MPSVTIEDFRQGVDRRKSILTSPPGTLYWADNVHLTRGGELEKRLAFVPSLTLPDASKGIASNFVNIFVFGPLPAPTLATPYVYVALTHPTGRNLVRIVGVTMFRGLPYTLALFDDGLVLHFYNGTIVPAWAPGGLYAAGGTAAASGQATACCTLGDKVYVVAGSTLYFCQNDGPMLWGTGVSGDGSIDMSTKYSGSEPLNGVSVYIDRLAIYSPSNTQIWVTDPDPAKYYQVQVMPNLGTLAGRSIVGYGDSDNFLLGRTGIRSLRARDLSNTAGSYDIGSAIDDLVNPYISGLSPSVIAAGVGILEPVNARYLLAVGNVVFVFSYFPTSQISAWTTYSLPFTIDSWAVVGARLYARSGNQVFLYGGASGVEYDNSLAEVILPYLDCRSPATIKAFADVAMAITGQWDLELGFDPNPPYARTLVGRFDHESFGMGRVGDMIGEGTHFGARFTSSTPARAVLSNFVQHYQGFDDEGDE